MSEKTYRASVYVNRITIQTPGDLGDVDIQAIRERGGVRIHIQPSPTGRLRGTPDTLKARPGGWVYAWRPPSHDLPLIGFSEAEVREIRPGDGAVTLFLPEGRSVMSRTVKGSKVAAPPPATVVEPLQRRGDMVREINAWKDELGDTLVLSITPEGRLRALVEYS